jgi:hypothetical protein
LGDSSAEKKGMNDRITHETISLASATNYNVISTNPAEEALGDILPARPHSVAWGFPAIKLSRWERDFSGSVREDPLLLVASEFRF